MQSIKRRGLMLVLSSPSGAGKTTLARQLLAEDPHIRTSISYTTRKIRAGEIDGVHYYFVDHNTFKQMIADNQFLEYAYVFGELYGTPRHFVEDCLSNGEDVLFDIDWQGNRSLTSLARADVASVYILPPSKKELLSRLTARDQNDTTTITYRISKANDELAHWPEYDYCIINRDVEDSVRKLMAILRAERLKKARRIGIAEFVTKLIEEEV